MEINAVREITIDEIFQNVQNVFPELKALITKKDFYSGIVNLRYSRGVEIEGTNMGFSFNKHSMRYYHFFMFPEYYEFFAAAEDKIPSLKIFHKLAENDGRIAFEIHAFDEKKADTRIIIVDPYCKQEYVALIMVYGGNDLFWNSLAGKLAKAFLCNSNGELLQDLIRVDIREPEYPIQPPKKEVHYLKLIKS